MVARVLPGMRRRRGGAARRMLPVLQPVFLLALLLAPLAGCVAAAGAGSVALTGKTPVDHVYSLVTGRQCSMVRKERGLTYCVEDEVEVPVAVHCYPTLGDVTCYEQAAPFPGGQRKLGIAPPPVSVAQRGPFDFVIDLVRPAGASATALDPTLATTAPPVAAAALASPYADGGSLPDAGVSVAAGSPSGSVPLAAATAAQP